MSGFWVSVTSGIAGIQLLIRHIPMSARLAKFGFGFGFVRSVFGFLGVGYERNRRYSVTHPTHTNVSEVWQSSVSWFLGFRSVRCSERL